LDDGCVCQTRIKWEESLIFVLNKNNLTLFFVFQASESGWMKRHGTFQDARQKAMVL
jgi:hypothetical protein